jgi:hypothetical protein
LLSNFSDSSLDSFSYQKILKSLNKFDIHVTNTDLDKLILESYSVDQIVDILHNKYNPSDLVSSNLPRFVDKYLDTYLKPLL